MLRTLIVCHDPPFPPTSGADLRNFGNATAAAAFGPVCLASLMPGADEARPDGLDIHLVQLSGESDKHAPSLGWWRSRGEHRIPRPTLVRLKALVQDFRPDTIVVEGVALFKLLSPLRRMAPQLILDMHNVESDLAAQLPRSKRWRPFSAGVRPLERKAAAIVDRIWVCSKLDRERLKAFVRPATPVDVVPNGIPRAARLPKSLPQLPAAADDFPLILYVGHLGYAPNLDAAERLARTIFPRVRERLPAAKLVVAGRSPGLAAYALAELEGVSLIKDPDDVGPLLSAAHLTIIPLAMGGGTRIKILEAMAWGVPVIATPLAAEGLDLVENDDFLRSDSDDGLAELAVRLCSDRARMDHLRARAYDTAWSRFGPEAIRDAVSHGLGLDGADPLTPTMADPKP